MNEGNSHPVEDTGMESGALFGAFRKLALASIGVLAMAQDEIENLIGKMVERGEIAEKDARKLVDELTNRRREGTKKAELEFDKHLDQALNRLNIPTKDDIEALSQKINALAKRVEELKRG